MESLTRIVGLVFCFAVALAGQMGSPGGGETQAIVLHPTEANIIYVGAAKGLCKTISGGQDNWPSTGLDSLSPRVLAINPQAPDTVYAGTYEMGVYKTANAAATWEPASQGITDLRIRALVLDPEEPDTLWAGTDGGGIFMTADGARTWTEKNRGLLDKVIRSLVLSADGTLFAGTWHGVYRSSDRGLTWRADPAGLYDVDVKVLALDPTDSNTIYAATDPRGVFRSDDAGWTWTKSREPLTERILALAVDPQTPDHVYVGTKAGVFRSTDRAESWEPAGLHWSSRTWTLVFDPRTDPPTLYYGGEGGVLKTQNGGKWWDVTGPQRR